MNELIINKKTIIKLSQPNNLIAAKHFLYRLIIELILLYFILYSIENRNYILYITIFWLTSIWHSFWGYAGLSHELFHNNVFSNKKINKLLLIFSTSLVWNNTLFFEKSHYHHHYKTFDKDDEEALGVQNWSFLSIISYIFIDFKMLFRKFKYLSFNLLGYIPNDKNHTKTSRKKISYNTARIFLLNLTYHMIIWHLFSNLLFNISFFLLPFTAQIFNRALAQSQHIGLKKHKDRGPLYHSRTIQLPSFFSFLYAGMNFHCEHHQFPSIPYYNLNKVHKILLNKGVTFNYVKTSFLFTNFWKLIKLQGNQNNKLSVKYK